MRPTVLKISLNVLHENARALRARLPENVRLMCVVKADGYGHGAAEAALAARDFADAYAVAIAEEAAALRKAGIEEEILILGGAREESLREAVALNAAQCVYTKDALDILEDEAEKRGTDTRAHLKMDTGMSRVGVRGDAELRDLLEH